MKFFLVVFAILAANYLLAQNGVIQGIVTDPSGNPIEGADIIYRKDVTRGARTDEKGFYRLELPSGTARIICRFTDMKTDTSSVLIEDNKTLTHDIQLRSLVKELEQFEVKVGKFDKSIEDQTVSMVVIKPQLIALRQLWIRHLD